MSRKLGRIGTGTLILFGSILLAATGCYEKAQVQTELPPVPVRTGTVEKRDVQLYAYFTGTTAADPVTIVPRVRGYIEKVNFEAGDIVQAGDILYEIEKFDYETQLQIAQAKADSAVALAHKAKADYDREISLQEKGTGFTTQADVDRTKAIWDDAQAEIKITETQIADAKKQLERCTIKSPVRGKISRTQIEVGNLVDGTGANPPTLTTIMPMDPIYVYFHVTDSKFDMIHKRVLRKIKEVLGDKFNPDAPYDNKQLMEIARANGLEEEITFDMGLRTDSDMLGQHYPCQGVITFNENQINSATGTMTLRGEIKNPSYLIYPGIICNVRVPIELRKDAVLIDERAVCYDLNEVYVWLLDANGMPSKQIITLGQQIDQKTRLVESGLNGGEHYVIIGTQSVRAGGKTVEMSEEQEAEEVGPEQAAKDNAAVPTTTPVPADSVPADSVAAPAPAETAPIAAPVPDTPVPAQNAAPAANAVQEPPVPDQGTLVPVK